MGTCGGDAFEDPAIGISVGSGPCSCTSPGYTIRPNIGTGNSNWGGVNTATCGGPSQTITLTFSGPGNPNYNLTTTNCAQVVPGTNDTGNHCDDCTTPVTLPFDVTFYDEVFSAGTPFNVSSNGNLQFNSTHNDTSSCSPFDGTNVIAPFWADLYTQGTSNSGAGIPSGVFTSVTGSAPNRVFHIEWRTGECCNPPNGVNDQDMEVRLYEGRQHIDFVYGRTTITHNGGIGLQRDTGSVSVPIGCGPRPSPGTQYSFAEITISAPNLIETVGNSFSGPISTFTTTRGGATSGDFTATIDWGDNTTDTGTISGGPGTGPYTVSGNHTYNSPGFFTINVRVTDNIDGHSDVGTTTAGPCDPPSMGLTNWWPADGNARDIWAGDNGTLENGATFAAGEVNQAFSLNGTNQYVDVGSVNLPTTFSIDAWVNPNDLSTRPIIIGKDDNASARSYAFEIESTGQLVGAVFSSAGLTLYETNSPVIVTGN